MKKHQVIVIHGGDNFETYEEYIQFLKDFPVDLDRLRTKGWKDTLQDRLGNDFEVLQPEMPNSFNARYSEWKIWFDKHVPLLEPEVVLVGHSLGGIFLAKYLAENDFQKKIAGTFLVAAPFDDKNADYSLMDFVLPNSLSKFGKQGGKIFLYHSKDDDGVPFVDLDKYKKAIPSAKTIIFTDRGHFRQPEFPELVADIKALFNS
ncbi:MAG: alpha/beta hydrolase [Patescibacteria group bacterium]|nr:alpha/beta hydrolase [Patescibacteria group bacterium]